MNKVLIIFGLFLCWSSCQSGGGSSAPSPGNLVEPGMKTYAGDTANSAPTLAQMDSIRSVATASDTISPIGRELNTSKIWKGMFRYMADAAYFTSCEDGVKYAVNGGKGYYNLERAYLELEPEGKPFYTTFKATATQIGRSKSIKIDEFLTIKNQNHCP